jgi:hypothetical protein
MTTVKKPMFISSLCAIMGGLLLSAGASYALSYTSQVRVINPRFEADQLTNGDFTINTITGWTAVNNGGNGGVYNPTNANYAGASSPTSIFTAAQGQNVVYTNGRTIEQTLTATFKPRAVYTLSVDVGKRLDEPFPSTGAVIQLLAGDTVIAEANPVTPIPASGQFVRVRVRYTPSPEKFQYIGQPLKIRLGSNDRNVFTGQVNYDNVRLDISSP